MKRIFSFLFSFLIALMNADDYICLTYFTQLGCRGCAQTDVAILHTWLREMPRLIVIEYLINGDSGKENQYVFLEYSKNFNRLSLVPQISYDDKNAIGPTEILPLKKFFKKIEEAECTLLDEEFDEMDLNKLPGKPNIWWRDRVLLKIGEGKINSDEIRELLFSRDIENILKNKRVDVQPLALSGNEVNFKRAYQISEGWIIQVGAHLKKEPAVAKEDGPEIRLPLFGKINYQHSLGILTILLGLADGLILVLFLS